MNKLIAIACLIAGVLAALANAGLVGLWAWVVSGVLFTGGIGSLFFKKEKTTVLLPPPSVVPVEKEKVKAKKEKLDGIKLNQEKSDNESRLKRENRKDEFEKAREHHANLDAIRAKLKSIRSGRDLP